MAGTSGTSPSTSDDPDVINMSDYLNMMREREKEAREILGGSDKTNCSYPSGYVKRQVVYSCLTCAASPTDPGGVCLACANTCHHEHHLVELYTKRNFKCDCGNSKFANKCQLCPEKDEVNALNKYNQNFRGEYCSCHRPYPDPAESFTRPMLQCVLCEDWYHENHLGSPNLQTNDENDMICCYCVDKYPFLRCYELTDRPNVPEDSDSDDGEGYDSYESDGSQDSWESEGMFGGEAQHGDNDVVDNQEADEGDGIPEAQGDGFQFNGLIQGEEEDVNDDESEDGEGIAQDEGFPEGDGSDSDNTSNDGVNLEEVDEDLGWEEVNNQVADVPVVDPSNGDNETVSEESVGLPESQLRCKLRHQNIQAASKDRAIFMTQHWRTELCRCGRCMNRYRSDGLEYLLDVEDTCEAYLMKGGEQETMSIDDAMRLLSDGGRVQQLDIIEGFNNMRTQLMEYLQRFKDTGETVTEEDMRDFFNGLLAKKRRRLE